MKKITLLFFVFILFSCSNSDDEVEEFQNVPVGFLKQVKDFNLGSMVVYNYYYLENKLLKIVSDNEIKRYTYTGDLITKIDVLDTTNNLIETQIFQYDIDNNLIGSKTLYYTFNYGNRIELNYNLDGTTSINHYSGNLTSQNTFDFINKLYFLNNEVIKSEINFNSSISTVIYEYDSNINPMHQVLGFSKLNLTLFNGSLPSQYHKIGNLNNCTKAIIDDPNISGIVDYDFTYNSNNFPSFISSDGQDTTIFDLGYFQYIYQE